MNIEDSILYQQVAKQVILQKQVIIKENSNQ